MKKSPHAYRHAPTSGILRMLCLLLLSISALTAWSQSTNSTVTGKVTDSKNAPMEGVNILIKGTKRGAVSGPSGNFSISNVPANATLVFSYTGYGDKEVAVKGGPVNVSLTEVATGLNDVVVIGYGTASKKDLTGAISQVKATQLENENPRSVQDILRGNVPGLDVGFDASTKGSSASLLVRGKSNFGTNSSSSPLIVLNGVIYGGQLADINPNDIATIDVLKDASASAIYGAQSSNGVVIITTKKGKMGKPIITYNGNIGMNRVTNFPHLLNGNEFVAWRQDVRWSQANFDSSIATTPAGPISRKYKFTNPADLPAGTPVAAWLALGGNARETNPTDLTSAWLSRLGSPFTDLEIANYKAGKSINMEDVFYNQNALQHDHTISVAQRKEDMSYYFSAGYLENQAITNGQAPYKTFRTRLNVEANIAKFLVFGVDVQYSQRNESGIVMNQDWVQQSSPWGNLYDPIDGSVTQSVNNDPAVSTNPLWDQQRIDRSFKYDNIFSIFSLKGKLPGGFSYESAFNPVLGYTQEYTHTAVIPSQAAAGLLPTASRYNRSVYNWRIDNTLRWNKSYGAHNIGAQFTQTAEKNQSWATTANASGFSPNDVLSYHNLGSGTVLVNPSSEDLVTKGAALMGRVTYDFKKRYYFNATYRRDGWSGFGASNPYANFYSAGAAWAISEENFMKGTASWLDYLKISASYGETGNRSISDPGATLYLLGTGSYVYLNNGNPYNLAIVFANTLANPSLSWEKKAGINIGLDYSVLRGAISGRLDYYVNRSKDLLVQRALPPISGFTSVWANLGSIQNKGFELSINTVNMKRPNFEWTTALSFWMNKNEVLHVYGPSPVYDATGKQIGMSEKSDTLNGYFIGQSINAVYDYQINGTWKSSQATEAKVFNQFPGDFRLVDQNGDGRMTASNDRVFQGTTDPKYSWNMRNDFVIYKNFSFAFTMYSRVGQLRNSAQNYNNAGFMDRANFYSRAYWTPNNQIDNAARLFSYAGSVSSGNFKSSSFIRISNISLGYTFPSKLVQSWGLQSLKVYTNVVNAAVISGWDWWDPENGGPTPMTYNFGVNVSL
jgi:TonB-linked SusC/RagA family outer membrane protein